jgi:MFS family permease
MGSSASPSPSPHALAHAPYRVFWGGSLISYTAQWVQQVALGFVVYDLTGSTLALGLVLGARAVPMLLLAPFSGVAADRYDRRHLLMGSQLVLVIATLAIGIGLALGRVGTLHLGLFVVLTGIAGVFERNARHSMVLDLVPREAVTSAVALNNLAFSGARMGAPGIAGFLIAAFGAAANFFLQAAAYLVVIATIATLRLAPHPRAAQGISAMDAMRQGLRFAWRDRPMRMLLVTGVVPYFLLYPVWGVLFPAFARDAFQVGPEGLGLMYAAVGIGGFLGGMAGAWIHRLERIGRVQLGALVGIAIGLAGAALAPTLPIALPFMVLAGMGEVLYTVANQTLVQLTAPTELRGRVTSLLAVFPAFISLGAIWLGFAGEALGPRGATACAFGFAVLSLVGTLLWARPLVSMRLSEMRRQR